MESNLGLDTLNDPKKIEEIRHSPQVEDNEIAQALYALLTHRFQLKPYKPQLHPLPSGAVPLFGKGFFPWGSLPYPEQHALLGKLLLQIDDGEMNRIAHHMARFQEATLDHNKKPFFSLLRQEEIGAYIDLENANRNFFEANRLTPSDEMQFSDPVLGIVSRRTEDTSCVFLGSGCKSGMGAFLSRDAGIVNFGPQLSPMGDCSAFGLAGRAQDVTINDQPTQFALAFKCRLSAHSTRKTQFFNLSDSRFSGVWMDAEITGGLNQISIRCYFEGIRSCVKKIFSFFCQGQVCTVAGFHKLIPCSLDRYQGPAQKVQVLGKKGSVQINTLEGASDMQIIPLAGDNNFWGANFLIAYTLSAPLINFSINLL